MLLGTYEPNLISKNRLALPAKLRKEITGDRVVLAVGFDDCILGFEEKKWEQVTASDLARPLSDAEGRDLRRKMFAGAEAIDLGIQGRFVIPEAMAEVLLSRPEHQGRCLPILGSFLASDEMCQTGAIERGVLWGLGRLGRATADHAPDALEAVRWAANHHASEETRRVAQQTLGAVEPAFTSEA